MQFDFFPSVTLTKYLMRLFSIRIVGILFMLILVLQMLDLLGESGKILAHTGNGQAQLLTYVSMRTPQLISRFLPYSVLLATLFTFWPLNQNSEIIAMRAAGLSAHQILAPMLLTAAAVAGVSFGFNEIFVSGASARLKSWQAVSYGELPHGKKQLSNVYIADGANVLTAEQVMGEGSAMRLHSVTYYLRNNSGAIVARITSPDAAYVQKGWQLDAPNQFDVATTQSKKLPSMIVGQNITPKQITMSSVDPDGQNIFELSNSINLLRESGRRTMELDGRWWHKFSGPLSAILMPLLGAVAAFGLARSGQLFIRAIIGMALGFTYFVVDNAALAMGGFGGYPPLIAAWAPFLLFLCVGETVLIRTEE
ncbi:MAG: hypothetical protein RLY97_744 [Pseudomonadota bacterium]